MLKPSLLGSIAVIAVATVGCRFKQAGSDTKTNRDVRASIDSGFKTLDPGAVSAICENKVLLVFVGNGEAMGSYEYGGGLTSQKSAYEKLVAEKSSADIRYHETIKKAATELKAKLKGTKCNYSHETKLTLLSLVDGPAAKDSTLEVTNYGFADKEWKASESTHYTYADGELKKETAETAFEINLPKSLSDVVSDVNEANGKHELIYYIFKTHGGLVSLKSQGTPTLAETMGKSQSEYDNKKRHVMLFDSHDADGSVIKSSLYSYFWTKTSACKVYGKLRDTSLYTNAGCAKVLAAATQGGGGSDTQGGGGSDTQGGGGSDTQGGGGSDTQGGGGSDTQGGGGSDTQAVGSLMSQGPGKELLYIKTFVKEPTLNDGNEPDGAKPDMIIHLGAAATYDLEEGDLKDAKDAKELLTHVHQLVLPMGTDTLKKPSFFVLDSCYGSDQIASSKRYTDQVKKLLEPVAGWEEKGVKGKLRIVTLSNPKPTYTHTIDYNALDASDYVAMPFLFYWNKLGEMPDSTDQIAPLAQNLHRAFMEPSDEVATDVAKAMSQRDKKIKAEDLDREQLKLLPIVTAIELDK